MRKVSWAPGVQTFVTQKSILGLPNDMDREQETNLPPGSATPNSPRQAEGDQGSVGESVRALPEPAFLKPDDTSGIKNRPRTLPSPSEGEHPYKNDYDVVTRRTMTGYERRIPWERQKKQRTWDRLHDKKYYERNKSKIAPRMRRWYKGISQNRTFLDRKKKYRDDPNKFKRKKIGMEPVSFFILPDFEHGFVNDISKDGVVSFTLDSGLSYTLALGSFLYVIEPETNQDEETLLSEIDVVDPSALDFPDPEDIEEIAHFVGYDISDVDWDSITDDDLDALLDHIVNSVSEATKTAYVALSPGAHLHHQHGVARRERHMNYMHNRAKTRMQNKRWYLLNHNKPQFVRRRQLRQKNPNRYKLKFATENMDIAFVVGPELVMGHVVDVTFEGTLLLNVPARGGMIEVGTMAFLNSVIFMEEDDIEDVFSLLDETEGLDAYPDIIVDDVYVCAILNDLDPDSNDFRSLVAQTIGVSDISHAGVDDLLRVCAALIDRSVRMSDMINRVASDILVYDRRPPDSGAEGKSTEGRPYKDRGRNQITLTEREPTHKPTPPDFVSPTTMVPNSGSGKVIPDSLKFAATISDIQGNTSSDVSRRAKDVRVHMKRADPENGIWTFEASGSNGGSYQVKIKALPKGAAKDINKLDVQVSCTCDFFRWQGPEHYAKTHKYLYGKPRGTASAPSEKDPSGKHWACKHVLAAMDLAHKYRIASVSSNIDGGIVVKLEKS